MRKAMIVAGWTLLGLTVLGGGFAAYVYYAGTELDATSKAYVDQSIPAIVSKWSKDELVRRASPKLRKAISDEQQLTRLFENLSRLGRLERYEGSAGEANMSVSAKDGKVVTALYVAHARFENGPAQITMRLTRERDQWQILDFLVHSPLLRQ